MQQYIACPGATVFVADGHFHRSLSCSCGAFETETVERVALTTSPAEPCPDCVLTEIPSDDGPSLAERLSTE
ncbi:hypothetical protein [Halococcus sediminicola]|uniref:hypothetical protein n=1 Tax=Halococcus sediminicola TaxID=1264579 RepID=UPI0012AB6CD4|nr:hypothetical protein [Halococcus sediminicola]